MRTHSDRPDDLAASVMPAIPAKEDESLSRAEAARNTFQHPDQVLADATLTRAEKRAILASWASDRRAVENAPALRRIDSGALMSIDDILAAMTTLDGPRDDTGFRTVRRLEVGRRTSSLAYQRARRSLHWTDRDDDPPPSAAAAARLFVPIFTEALARSA